VTGPVWWGLVLALYLAAAVGRDPRVFVFALMLSAAAAASSLWARFALAGFRYERHLSALRLFFGEESELALEVYNAKPLPLPWVLLSDRFPAGLTLLTGQLGFSQTLGYRHAIVNLLALRWYERVRRVYRVRGDKRGAFEFGPCEVYAGDLFGFRRRHLTVQACQELIVYPKLAPVLGLQLLAARPSGEYASALRVVEDPLRFMGVRQYLPGDSYRHLHWKATARTGTLQTRTFDPGASRNLVLMLDVQTTARPYSVVEEFLELLVSAAASVASEALEQGFAVGLLSNGGTARGGDWTYVPPGRHTAQVVQVLEALARLTAFRLMPFSQLASLIGAALPFGSTVVALSAWPDDAMQEALLGLKASGYPVVLLTAGDERAVISRHIDNRHLGGTDAWQNLAQFDLA
jgi:uncharacterized protein (DUF58 family)